MRMGDSREDCQPYRNLISLKGHEASSLVSFGLRVVKGNDIYDMEKSYSPKIHEIAVILNSPVFEVVMSFLKDLHALIFMKRNDNH